MANRKSTRAPSTKGVTKFPTATVGRVFADLEEHRGLDFALALALRDELERLGIEDLIQARRLCELLFDRLGDRADIRCARDQLLAPAA